jgi:hypothetical protein
MARPERRSRWRLAVVGVAILIGVLRVFEIVFVMTGGQFGTEVIAGYSYQAQKYHADAGNWVRIDRGLYRLPEWPVRQHDHFVRRALWSHGRAVVSHESALSVHDLEDVNPTVIHLTVPTGVAQEHDDSVTCWSKRWIAASTSPRRSTPRRATRRPAEHASQGPA